MQPVLVSTKPCILDPDGNDNRRCCCAGVQTRLLMNQEFAHLPSHIYPNSKAVFWPVAQPAGMPILITTMMLLVQQYRCSRPSYTFSYCTAVVNPPSTPPRAQRPTLNTLCRLTPKLSAGCDDLTIDAGQFQRAYYTVPRVFVSGTLSSFVLSLRASSGELQLAATAERRCTI